MFPDPTQDEQEHMENMAKKLVRKLGMYCGDEKALKEDLEMAGWIAFYQYFTVPEEKRWLEVRNAMKNAWSLWRFGVTARSRSEIVPRKIETPLSYEDGIGVEACPELGVEERSMLHECRDHIFEHLNTRRHRTIGRTLIALCFADGLPLSNVIKRSFQISSPSMFYDQKKTIRGWAEKAIRECAPAWCRSYLPTS